MKARLILIIISIFITNISMANDLKKSIEFETQVYNKKFGGPKSDFVLKRIKFNFESSLKNKYGNWVMTSNGEIVRCCLESRN